MYSIGLKLILAIAAILVCGPLAAQTTTTLAAGPNSPAAGNVPRGAINAPLVQFNLDRTMGAAGTQISFTALTLINTGTAVSADYSQYRLYRDTDSNGAVGGTDILLATTASPSLSFSGFSNNFTGAGANYLVTVDTAFNATVGNTFVIQITTANITVSSTSKTGGPVNGNTRTISAPAGASAAVYRGATFLPDGAGTNDNTGFHFATVSYTVTYTIANVGQAALNLTGTPLVAVGALTNCTANVTTPPSTPVAAGTSTTFVVTVMPLAAGAYSAPLSFANNDAGPGKNPYNWNLQGTGVSGADLNVERSAVAVPDASTDTVTGAQATVATVLIYTLRNDGNQNLTITTPVATPGAQSNCVASISAQPTSPVAAGASVTMNVTVTPNAAGLFSCTITVNNSSLNPGKNPYTWTISGTASAAGPTLDHLTITTQPGGAQGGTAFATQPVIEARDSTDTLIATFTGNIVATISAGPAGTLSGTTTLACVAGVCTFTNLSIDLAGAGYTLNFAAGAINVDSSAFSVTVGPAAQLAVSTDPAGATGGSAFTTQPVVQVLDAGGNLVTSATNSITASITTGSGTAGAVLSGTLTVAASGGVATFTDLEIDLVGTGYTLDFDDGTLPVAASGAFDVTLGAAVALQIVVAPGGATQAVAFTTQPQVEIVDAGGNRITTDNSTQITASIMSGTGTAGAVLSGTNPVTMASGLATFTNLSIDLPGTGYVLTFTNGTLSLNSAAFNVAGVPTALGIATQPGGASAGVAFVTQPVVEVRDGGGSVVSSDNSTQVTAAITGGTGTAGAVLSGTLTVTCVNGVATFTNLAIDLAGTGYTLTFTSAPVLTPVASAAFGVAGAATQLAISTQPAGAAPGVVFTTQPVVTIRDAGGVVVSSDNTTQVTAAITPATGAAGAVLSGTLTVTAVNGVAVFTNLSIDLAGTGYTLTFTSAPVLTPATSNAFNVATGGTGGGGGGGGGEDEGCTTGEGDASLLLLGALFAAAFVVRRRRLA